jgi:Tol biopolymer transport system component
LDRRGQSTILSKSGAYYAPEISPDGNSIAFRDAESDIVVYDWQRDALRRVTFDVAGASFPVWSPDSQRLIYRTSTDRRRLSLESVRADGSAQPDRLVDFDLPFSTDAGPNDVSPDGSLLLLTTMPAGEFGTQHDIMAFALDGAAANRTSSLEVIVDTPVPDRHARISPDGRWIAYQSGMLGGEQEVYVEPFRFPGGKSQVSGGGGHDPRWSPKGDELFYRNGDRVFSVSYRVDGDAFETDRPRELFRADVLTDDRSYDVFPDGEHFLMLQPAGGQSVAPTEAVVVLNWVEELKRLVPIGN